MTEDTADNETSKESQSVKEQSEDKFLVVGIGASAGGIQALKEFFAQVPKKSDMAYVVILHMSPEHESKLAEILQTISPIPVTQVTEREKIKPNHVYVVPPTQNLAMSDGHVTLTDKIGAQERRSPVDLFFRTLAENNEDRGVSVILSGTGANGSMGIKRIKEHGGVTFVQDPEEAEYNDMPKNAIATGMVDYVLRVADIPAKIISYKEHLGAVQIPATPLSVAAKEEQALHDIFTQLRLRTGHDFSNYKRETALRRIERRMGLTASSGLEAYAHFMQGNPQESNALMKDLLISVTNFFRDPEAIESLAKQVIPKIFTNRLPEDPVRVWVAGCATGEEAYSIAMLLYECPSIRDGMFNLQVFATDLDQEAIQIAREGLYTDAEVADVSPERLRRFFFREPHGYRVSPELRESILFAAHNVLKDPPFSHLDLISCRNLLIYLNRTAQNRVLEVLHFALNPSGYLILGTSESIDGAGNLFVVEDTEHHIFRSRPVAPRALPIPEIPFRPTLRPLNERQSGPEEARAGERLSFAELHQRLLEEYGPPSVIVNEDYEIVHLTQRAGRYLQLRGGEPSHNLLKIVRPELRLELRTALYQAVHDRTNIEVSGLKVDTADGTQIVNIIVRPVLRDEDAAHGFLLVLFEETKDDVVRDSVSLADEPIAHWLEEELVRSKAQLRGTVEQYEIKQEELRASNEELQAMNEELRSTAEELETSKEELQSVNEELSTVNQQLKIKIEELSQANNNFQNLMNATNVGTIFLDQNLIVREFTPSAQETFNLIATDIGRPLLDITTKLKDVNLISDLEGVLRSLHIVERHVRTVDQKSYVMRIAPFRTLQNKIEGLVLTVVDITELTQVRNDLLDASQTLASRNKEHTHDLEVANEALRDEVKVRKRGEEARIELLGQLVTAQEDERHRFARDLHDQLGQQLTALKMKLESLKIQAANRAQLSGALDDLQGIVKQLDSDVEFLAWQLRPLALDDLGLPAALSNYVKQWSEHFGVPAEFHAGKLSRRFNPKIETNFYRIAQEALNNCAKHSHCSRADVLLECRGEHLVLIVEDDGVGFNPPAGHEGDRQWGLIGMQERSALLEGTIEIESTPGSGTTIYVRVPLMGDGGGESK